MHRRKFIGIAAGTVVAAGTTYYLFSDKTNFSREQVKQPSVNKEILKPDEKEILFLSSLAPSGHNTQPWFIRYVAPYHWIIGNDKSKWLPGVDPAQRETILSIGAFMQNLEYAAGNFGYACQFNIIALTNQDESIAEVKLYKSASAAAFDVEKIKKRRTVRSNYLSAPLQNQDLTWLTSSETNLHFIPNVAKEYQVLNEQTIEANRAQSYRNAAQKELSEWIRFSSNEAEKYRDGLTTASMEINGISGWILRNYYGEKEVMKDSFREQSIDKVKKQVSQSAGWMLLTSKGSSTATLLETGKRLQRLFLKVRDKSIALHPMTQILEEAATNKMINQTIGITDTIQFILRTGYVKTYPDPVSLRRPVERFVRM